MKRNNYVFLILIAFLLVIPESASPWPWSKKTCPDPLDAVTDVDKKLLENFDSSFFLDPETVEKMDSRTLAKMIISRLHNICDNLRDPSGIAAAEGSSEIVMLVPDKYLGSIIQNGFKNQHQTSVTGGSYNKAGRLMAEDGHILLTVPYSDSSRELLPKYALQVFKGTDMGQFNIPVNYGNILFRFNPEVNDRATWAETDSLGISNPLRTNKLRPQKNQKCRIYCEAQIWGELDMSDVKSITIPRGMPVTDEMKSIGVPIYEYDSCFNYNPASPTCKEEAPDKTSISRNTNESPDPVYTPPDGAKPTKASQTLDEIKDALKTETNPVAKVILESRRLKLTPTSELTKEYQSYLNGKVGPTPSSTPSTYYGGLDVLASTKVRLLAELAARPKTKTLNDFLIYAFQTSTQTEEKSMALSGLSKLDPAKLKPLLTGLLSNYDLSGSMARAMALQMRSDPEIRKALESNPASNDMLSKIEKNQLCQPEVHD